MPDITGYSKNDVITLCNLLNIDYIINGNGYVEKQSIETGKVLNDGDILEVKLKLLYTK